MCWADADLTKAGRFAVHYIRGADRYAPCPMTGEPVPVITPDTEEVTC